MGFWSEAVHAELAERLSKGEAQFGFAVGEVDVGDLPEITKVYGDTLVREFEAAGLSNVVLNVENHEVQRFIEIDAENEDGSTFFLIFQVGDLGEISVNSADGISVQNGDRIDIGFAFEDREHAFKSIEDVKRFLEWAKTW